MANVKISQLTPKGANLSATDLLEISEFNGSGYETKSITGQEIIDAASGGGAAWGSITGTLSSQTDLQTALDAKQDDLISGTNIKTINGNSVLGSGDISISSGVTDVTATSPIVSTGGATPDISISQAGAATDGYLSTGDWNAFNNKQDALSSGVNIKTINSTSVLGSGNIAVQPTLVSGTNIKTINGSSVLGSGDLTIGGSATGVHANFTLTSGQFVSSVITSMTAQNGALLANTMYLVPFYPAQTITCSTLNMSVSIAVAGAICRILIYSESNGDPNIKLYESTNLDCSTTGVKSVATTFTFNAGTIYYLCIHSSAAISANIAPQAVLMPIPYRSSSQLSAWNAFRLTAAIGSAPSPFSGGTLNSANNPIVIIQKA